MKSHLTPFLFTLCTALYCVFYQCKILHKSLQINLTLSDSGSGSYNLRYSSPILGPILWTPIFGTRMGLTLLELVFLGSHWLHHRARTRRSSNFPPSKERRSPPPAACSWNKFHNTMDKFEVRQAFLSWRTLISIDINGITTIHTTHCHCILRWLHTWTGIQK